jgi:cellulose synthase/poly-beta-1,6-N-acetylglucosamine synthase-like glycosyltransferase
MEKIIEKNSKFTSRIYPYFKPFIVKNDDIFRLKKSKNTDVLNIGNATSSITSTKNNMDFQEEYNNYVENPFYGVPSNVTIIIPCHNEEKGIRATIESCINQTRKPLQILVINDGSTDNSAKIIEEYSDKVDVVTISEATGNKSYAQEIGLDYVKGEIFFATDGDTILDKHVIEEVERTFASNPSITAVGGYVKSLKHNWLTACRELDYIVGQDLHKVAQSYIDAVFVIPGCAGAFRTKKFKENIKFDHDTLTEDLDFTYKLHKNYFRIAYNKKVIAYTQDPATISDYINQMRRWYGGGWQNLKKHYEVIGKPNNALQLSLTYVEGLIFSAALFIFPIVSLSFFKYFLIPYLILLMVLGAYGAIVRKRLDLLLYAPTYLILVFVNAWVFLEQFWREIILNKTNLVWFHPERRELVANK